MGEVLIEVEFAEENSFHTTYSVAKYPALASALVDAIRDECPALDHYPLRVVQNPSISARGYTQFFGFRDWFTKDKEPHIKVRYPRLGSFEVSVSCPADLAKSGSGLPPSFEVWSKLRTRAFPDPKNLALAVKKVLTAGRQGDGEQVAALLSLFKVQCSGDIKSRAFSRERNPQPPMWFSMADRQKIPTPVIPRRRAESAGAAPRASQKTPAALELLGSCTPSKLLEFIASANKQELLGESNHDSAASWLATKMESTQSTAVPADVDVTKTAWMESSVLPEVEQGQQIVSPAATPKQAEAKATAQAPPAPVSPTTVLPMPAAPPPATPAGPVARPASAQVKGVGAKQQAKAPAPAPQTPAPPMPALPTSAALPRPKAPALEVQPQSPGGGGQSDYGDDFEPEPAKVAEAKKPTTPSAHQRSVQSTAANSSMHESLDDDDMDYEALWDELDQKAHLVQRVNQEGFEYDFAEDSRLQPR